jgi:hypothetical protein
MDHPAALRSVMVRPSPATLVEWAGSCLAIRWFEGVGNLGGWSPGRSVEVKVFLEDGSDSYYFKLFDEDTCDVDLAHPIPVACLGPVDWVSVWKEFINTSFRMVLMDMHRLPHGMRASTMVVDMIRREVFVWNGELVLLIADALGHQGTRHPDGPVAAARLWLQQWSAHYFWERVRELARLPDPEVFQLFPELVMALIRSR